MQPDVSVRKVLIFRTGSLGDTLVALPSLHLIARVFPNAKRVLLTTFPWTAKASDPAAILNGTGLIHDFMHYPAGTRNVGKMLRLSWQVRRFRPDLLIYLLQPRTDKEQNRDRRFFRLAGVRRFVGLLGAEELKSRFDAATGLYEQEAARLARSIAQLGDARVDDLASWDLHLSAAEREAAARALGPLAGKPLIVCGPGTKMQAKDWGPENWRDLLAQMYARYPGCALAMIGVAADGPASDVSAEGWKGPKINLCGNLSARESAAVIERALIFLGPDSGPMHLAACVGVPCVIPFSARGLPGMWYPAGKNHQIIYHQTSCFGCNLETCLVEARRCLTSISVAEVLAAVDHAMTQQAAARK